MDELSESERLWLRQYQRREAQILEENFGLRLEIRLEGVMALDPQDELTDMRFPRDGTLGQAALLAVAELVERLTPERAVEHGAGARRRARVRRVPAPDRARPVVVEGVRRTP